MNDDVEFVLFTPSCIPVTQISKRQEFQKQYSISNVQFRQFLIESDYIDLQEDQNRLIISLQQISFISDENFGVLLLKVGRLSFYQAENFAKILLLNTPEINILEYLFEQINLFLSENLVQQFDEIMSQTRKEKQISVKLLQNVSRIIRSLESIISILSQILDNEIINNDIIENYLENHQNLRHEAREVENLVKIQQINRHLHLSSYRNEILKYTLIFNFFSTAVSFSSVIFSLFGMNFNSFIQDSTLAFWLVIVLTGFLTIGLFYSFMRFSRNARNVYE